MRRRPSHMPTGRLQSLRLCSRLYWPDKVAKGWFHVGQGRRNSQGRLNPLLVDLLAKDRHYALTLDSSPEFNQLKKPNALVAGRRSEHDYCVLGRIPLERLWP
jgi:hypothetical protein